ncbi:hypothetical protein [Sulfuricurvum sp.]|uniref:hypothetical protein n=1 Tax=Sulfuricurvum sp. TaxID=2025608 RepID=UPI002604896D|nr:hypothetical protein [Sulfuricurvum sp.]MDD2267708.1 hypothetical protein [Sulfuricurvum sp.]MDD2783309.1 hypothetical protein [Sulfuricurvum sp.]
MINIDKYGIRSFPKDNIQRVIWWYGPVIKNPHDSNNPLVLILARPILNNDLSQTVNILIVTLPELDTVRLGTIWLGANKLDRLWRNYEGHRRNQSFEFNFTKHNPESIQFLSKKPNSQYGYIPPYKYFLGNFEHDPDISSLKRHYFQTYLTKLVSDDGMTVLVPSLELLSGAVAPGHKLIRSGLVNYPLDTMLSKYMNKAYIKDNEYFVDFSEEKILANQTVLAYLRLNEISRSRLKPLWQSMQVSKVNQTGTASPYKYPIVLPYHPYTLRLEGDGIQIDKDTFLLLRIYGSTLPNDYQVHDLAPSKPQGDPTNNNGNGKKPAGKNPEPLEVPGNDQYEITEILEPDDRETAVRIRSEVRIIGTKPIITTVIDNDSSNNPVIISSGEESESDRNEPDDEEIDDGKPSEEKNNDLSENKTLSSGEPDSRNESKGNKPAEQEKLETTGLNTHFKKIIAALHALVLSPDSDVASFVYVNNYGQEFAEETFCTLKGIKLPPDYKGRWFTRGKKENSEKNEYILRKFLIAKVILKNKKIAYLLEIERKENEAFLGLIFNTEDGTVPKPIIADLLRNIAIYKGRYYGKKTEEEESETPLALDLSVHLSMPYRHPSSYQLTKIIARAIRKNIFLEQFFS